MKVGMECVEGVDEGGGGGVAGGVVRFPTLL